jgi:hypothetical protein
LPCKFIRDCPTPTLDPSPQGGGKGLAHEACAKVPLPLVGRG